MQMCARKCSCGVFGGISDGGLMVTYLHERARASAHRSEDGGISVFMRLGMRRARVCRMANI